MTERVPLDEICGRCGYGGNEYQFDTIVRDLTGMDISRAIENDWAGRPSLPVAVAAEVTSAVTGAVEAHNDRWDRYQQYLRDRADAAQAERDAAFQRQHEEQQRTNRKLSDAAQANYDEKGRRELAKELEKRRQRYGSPARFEDFDSRMEPILRRHP